MDRDLAMSGTAVSDFWIMNQLMGIRTLERELANTLKRPQASGKRELQQRMRQLNSWVDAVDQALAIRAESTREETLPKS